MSLAVLGVVVLVSLLTPRFLKLRVEFQDRVLRPLVSAWSGCVDR